MKYLISFLAAIVAFTTFAQESNYNYAQQAAMRREKFLQFSATKEEPGRMLSWGEIAAKLRLGYDIERCRKDFLYRVQHPTGDMFFRSSNDVHLSVWIQVLD